MGQTRGSWEVSEMGSTCCHSAMSLGIPGPCASSLPHQSGPGHLQELLWTKYRIVSCSIKSDSLRPHGLEPTRLLYSWNFPGKNTGVGCHFLLQGIFLTQGSYPRLLCLLHWQAVPPSPLGTRIYIFLTFKPVSSKIFPV